MKTKCRDEWHAGGSGLVQCPTCEEWPFRKWEALAGYMTYPMYSQVYQLLCEVRCKEEEILQVTRVNIRRDGYDRDGRYFGTLATGERMFRIETGRGLHYVRARITLTQLKSALKEAEVVS